MDIDIQYEMVEETCRHCGQAYGVARGPVLDGNEGIGLYLVGLHHCEGQPGCILTVAIVREEKPQAFTLQLWATSSEIQMAFIDSSGSPWAPEGYLGELVTAEGARQHELKDVVFEVADLIYLAVPEVGMFLGDRP